ncbi:MAG: hypothetical protein BWY59_00147 [Verrucomicrobia bacterium ADurb.Bin345]|nr:MAG: hypothetical protein BWY59_00147 [Verrucomicrobia bacterium ADurb.Bin345]
MRRRVTAVRGHAPQVAHPAVRPCARSPFHVVREPDRLNAELPFQGHIPRIRDGQSPLPNLSLPQPVQLQRCRRELQNGIFDREGMRSVRGEKSCRIHGLDAILKCVARLARLRDHGLEFGRIFAFLHLHVIPRAAVPLPPKRDLRDRSAVGHRRADRPRRGRALRIGQRRVNDHRRDRNRANVQRIGVIEEFHDVGKAVAVGIAARTDDVGAIVSHPPIGQPVAVRVLILRVIARDCGAGSRHADARRGIRRVAGQGLSRAVHLPLREAIGVLAGLHRIRSGSRFRHRARTPERGIPDDEGHGGNLGEDVLERPLPVQFGVFAQDEGHGLRSTRERNAPGPHPPGIQKGRPVRQHVNPRGIG